MCTQFGLQGLSASAAPPAPIGRGVLSLAEFTRRLRAQVPQVFRQDADDLVQETLLRLRMRVPGTGEFSNGEAILASVILRFVIGHFSRRYWLEKRTVVQSPASDLDGFLGHVEPDESDSEAERLEQWQILDSLHIRVGPFQQRVLQLLRRSCTETAIAEELGAPIPRVRRAIENIRRRIVRAT